MPPIIGNLLRQMNAKLRLSLYHLYLPPINKVPSLIIGIYAIKGKGNEMIISCCATCNLKATKGFSMASRLKMPIITEEEKKKLEKDKVSYREYLEEKITI